MEIRVNVRMDRDRWAQAQRRADTEGLTMSELVRGWVQSYIDGTMPTVPAKLTADEFRQLVAEVTDQLGVPGVARDVIKARGRGST